ncbi:MAG: beta-lactamase family protein [Bacteroides sp.]|nr:beta-lactamase family protein [Bacteroides sp.]
MKKLHLPIVFLCISVCFSCGHKPGMETQVEKELDRLFTDLFPADEPGAAVLVARGDSILYNKGFGLARLDTLSPMTGNTMLNIASVSKQFSAVALCLLEEQGKLSLAQTVKDYFPSYKAGFYDRITLHHLLTHTSGLPDSRDRTNRDFMLYCQEEESCRYLIDLDSLAFEPGTHYEYQNPTYQLMLMIVEQASGERFDDFMRNHLFDQAGMPDAVYFEPQRYIPRMAHAYLQHPDTGAWEEHDYGEANFFGTKADGGLYTSAEEFFRWHRALWEDRILSPGKREAVHTGYTDTDIPDTRYGYGWFIEQRPDRPQKIYHTGDNGAFLLFEGYYPDPDLFYLVFANRCDWEREETVEKMDRIFEKAGWLK